LISIGDTAKTLFICGGDAGTGVPLIRVSQTEDAMVVNELPMETRSLLLRHLVLEDAVAFHALSEEEASRTWLPSQVYQDHSHARSVLASLIDHYSTPGNPTEGPYVLAIEHRTDGTLIGHVGFSPLDKDVEIGFSIAARCQRQGLATEAIGAASRWVFRTFGLTRILGVTSAANIASLRTLQRAGFVHEQDRVMRFQGTEEDVCVYVLFGT
jgi:RimJ/RimL family protein N-acetyltransferase